MGIRVLAATRKGLFTLERSGPRDAPWQIERSDFLGDNLSLALPDARSGKIYAALEHGHFGVKLHRAAAPGAPFEECAAPSYPPKPDGLVDTDGFGKTIPWSTVKIWALQPGGAEQEGVIWCGTIPGGLFRSDDHGATWDLMRGFWDDPRRQEWFGGGADLPGIHSVCVDPRDSNIVRVGISCGGVWATRDGGATWANEGHGMWADHMPPEQKFNPNIQDAHCLAQCRSHPDALWVQHHNGIFRSIDDGKTWVEIENVKPSSFGFPVVVHPKEPDTAWFVPAIKDELRIPVDGQFVVTRTRDGGKTFDILSKGLPSKPAYDIVYRHALAVSSGGDDLVMGSTTGGLWVSDDQGDTWTTTAARLPPVHSVHFLEF